MMAQKDVEHIIDYATISGLMRLVLRLTTKKANFRSYKDSASHVIARRLRKRHCVSVRRARRLLDAWEKQK